MTNKFFFSTKNINKYNEYHLKGWIILIKNKIDMCLSLNSFLNKIWVAFGYLMRCPALIVNYINGDEKSSNRNTRNIVDTNMTTPNDQTFPVVNESGRSLDFDNNCTRKDVEFLNYVGSGNINISSTYIKKHSGKEKRNSNNNNDDDTDDDEDDDFNKSGIRESNIIVRNRNFHNKKCNKSDENVKHYIGPLTRSVSRSNLTRFYSL
nr:MAG: hypothetical protein [Metapenaeopsis lamellata majanivirus]